MVANTCRIYCVRTVVLYSYILIYYITLAILSYVLFIGMSWFSDKILESMCPSSYSSLLLLRSCS